MDYITTEDRIKLKNAIVSTLNEVETARTLCISMLEMCDSGVTLSALERIETLFRPYLRKVNNAKVLRDEALNIVSDLKDKLIEL